MTKTNKEQKIAKSRVCKHSTTQKSVTEIESSVDHAKRDLQPPNESKTFSLSLKDESLVMWRNPRKTVKYCFLETKILVRDSGQRLLHKRGFLIGLITFSITFCVLSNVKGPHYVLMQMVLKQTWFAIHWIGLGILSSVGLGTGLHTFLLYLGPHIASVTLAAYECNSIHFPRPPYPEEIICPETASKELPSLWDIMSKVRLEAFLWGAGTALGELPPYFMAKAARLSNRSLELHEEIKQNSTTLSKGKLLMETIVNKVGFLGILACASIPNPLFDLAGITCGHFLVPFWKFFGATFIGKAVIKMHIQKIFVIIAFNDSLFQRIANILQEIPVLGTKLQEPFQVFFRNQKSRLHRLKTNTVEESINVLSLLFDTFVAVMVCFFVISIIHSLAQNYHYRLYSKRKI